ncbi:MAG TPA: DNA-3-methyladenine glycosylase I, partial [Blastocatellia bacterium]
LKINAAIGNAGAFLEVQDKYGSFDAYIWQFVSGRPMKNEWKSTGVQTHTIESDAMSKELKLRGFKFMGTTICYAFMQAVGMVNDHRRNCFRYKEIG